jgi:phosphoglycolate phosphatase
MNLEDNVSKGLMMMAVPSFFPQQRPKALLFDWDNTLVDTWLTCYEAINKTRLFYGHAPYTPERFSKEPHMSLRESFPLIFEHKAQEAEQFFYSQVNDTHLETLQPLPGAEKLLQWAVQQGLYVGVVSNKAGELLRKEVQHLGWGKYFKKIIGSYDTEADKPSHIPLLAALKGSFLDPGHQVWFVGDSCVDVLCAQRAGCVPVTIGEHAAKPEEIVVQGKDCLQLARILSGLPLEEQAA